MLVMRLERMLQTTPTVRLQRVRYREKEGEHVTLFFNVSCNAGRKHCASAGCYIKRPDTLSASSAALKL